MFRYCLKTDSDIGEMATVVKQKDGTVRRSKEDDLRLC